MVKNEWVKEVLEEIRNDIKFEDEGKLALLTVMLHKQCLMMNKERE